MNNVMKCIITGAGKGVGFEMALALNKVNNYEIHALSRSKDDLLHLKELAIKNDNKSIYTLSGDINDITQQQWETYLREIGGVDILILNAAELIVKPLSETTNDEWQRIFKTNFWTPLNFINWSIPMFNKGPKQILIIGTIGVLPNFKQLPNIAAYLASKAALHCLLESYAAELKDLNFHFNLIALGSTDTRMSAQVTQTAAKQSPQKVALYIKDYLLNEGLNNNGEIKIVNQF